MRRAAFFLLALALVGCSRQQDEPRDSPLGVIVLPATDPKLPPHPDLKLKYEEFAAKHFPREYGEWTELQNRTQELDAAALAARAAGQDPRKFEDEIVRLVPRVRETHEGLAKLVSDRKAELKGRGRP